MRGVVLCADDYALTEGVSRSIEELAAAGAISATSALVTTRHWAEYGPRVRELTRHVAVGLHLNFTLGKPLAPMPRLARGGAFPGLGAVVRAALLGRICEVEVREETLRQIHRFEAMAGQPPAFVDGHQHVHALPTVRRGVLAALCEAFPERGPWVRDPAERLHRILARRTAVAKSLGLSVLALGFGRAARGLGFVTNDGFAGVSSFDRSRPFDHELDAFLTAPGPAHLVMCHPGHVDAELAALDPVVERRADEHRAVLQRSSLRTRLVRRPGERQRDVALRPVAGLGAGGPR